LAGFAIAGVGGLMLAFSVTVTVVGVTISGPVLIGVGGLIAVYGMATADPKGKAEKIVETQVTPNLEKFYIGKGPDGKYQIHPEARDAMTDEQVKRWQKVCDDKNRSIDDCDPPQSSR
jgi:hypothetical protein